jgi:hypothetical protein
MLAPRSRAPSGDPEMRIVIQATMLRIRVKARTSQSWKSRVIRGREASGISSEMSWKMRGKTVQRLCSTSYCRFNVRLTLTRREVVSPMCANVIRLLGELGLSSREFCLPAGKLLLPGLIRRSAIRLRVFERVGIECMGGCKRILVVGRHGLRRWSSLVVVASCIRFKRSMVQYVQ